MRTNWFFAAFLLRTCCKKATLRSDCKLVLIFFNVFEVDFRLTSLYENNRTHPFRDTYFQSPAQWFNSCLIWKKTRWTWKCFCLVKASTIIPAMLYLENVFCVLANTLNFAVSALSFRASLGHIGKKQICILYPIKTQKYTFTRKLHFLEAVSIKKLHISCL